LTFCLHSEIKKNKISFPIIGIGKPIQWNWKTDSMELEIPINGIGIPITGIGILV
jgi:hypothetical protein